MQVEIENPSGKVSVMEIPDGVHTQDMILNMIYNHGKNEIALRDIIRLDDKKYEIRAFGFKEIS